MKIASFEIRNFKGIDHATIHLSDKSPGNICTLIGLNESGKTTILEAISNFVTEDKTTSSLVKTVHQGTTLSDIIPKDKKAAFTGRISIKGTVTIEKIDKLLLVEHMKEKHNITVDFDRIPNFFTVDRSIEFEDSAYKSSNHLWSLTFWCKKPKSKKYIEYTSDRKNMDNRKIWLSAIAFIQRRMPKIVYFPTFLFDFPDRIYLENNDEEINLYYKQVMQDVLDSQGDGLSIQRHIIDRIQRLREEHKSKETFVAFLFGRDEKKQIDAVLQKASNKISEVIFGSWNQILGRNVSGKRVQIDWLLDGEKDNATYVEISIVDGQSTYSLSERSLGFRWFFSFLLFTQFRKNRIDVGATVFVFDEPAANLHSKAQMKLLESFNRVAKDDTYIIYSTHSHYMVNPLWLEKAYIIENKATNYDKDDDFDHFSEKRTEINAIKYRTFVGSYPTKTTYFQPVLDALDVSFSPLVRSSRAVIVEGKNDYFAIKYLRRSSLDTGGPDIFPANGAGDISSLISLFRGWGVDFRILLDDDKAGRTARQKYMDDYLIPANNVRTIGDIQPSLSGKSFEKIYQSDVVELTKQKYDIHNPGKKHFSILFQELLVSQADVELKETEAVFEPISKWIDAI